MDNITTGHWIYAIIASGLYILFTLWSYRKEKGYIKWFNLKPLPIIIWCGILLLFIIATS